MRKIILVLIFGIALTGNAQDLSQWQIGLNVNPFFFSRIQKSEILKKDRQDFPNGFGFGLTLEKNWNEHFGIKTGLEFCTQNQTYAFTYSIFEQTQTVIDATVSYYKFPITLQYHMPINKKLCLTFNQGFQASFLNESEVYENLINDVQGPKGYNVHKNTQLGILGSVGIKNILSERFSCSANVRYEYDLTSSDQNIIHGYLNENNFGTTASHNFRLGLELGVQYHFSLDHVRFNKNPK